VIGSAVAPPRIARAGSGRSGEEGELVGRAGPRVTRWWAASAGEVAGDGGGVGDGLEDPHRSAAASADGDVDGKDASQDLRPGNRSRRALHGAVLEGRSGGGGVGVRERAAGGPVSIQEEARGSAARDVTSRGDVVAFVSDGDAGSSACAVAPVGSPEREAAGSQPSAQPIRLASEIHRRCERRGRGAMHRTLPAARDPFASPEITRFCAVARDIRPLRTANAATPRSSSRRRPRGLSSPCRSHRGAGRASQTPERSPSDTAYAIASPKTSFSL
jgi:hypothetical protein